MAKPYFQALPNLNTAILRALYMADGMVQCWIAVWPAQL